MPKKQQTRFRIRLNKSRRVIKTRRIRRTRTKSCGCKKRMSKRETKRFDRIMRVKVLK
jgi:hypothetical protein